MSDRIDTKNHPTIKALIAHLARLNVTDAVFAQRYLGISKTTWSQLQSGTYPADDLSPMLATCEAALRVLNDAASAKALGGERAQILELSHIAAALQAVKDCYHEKQNRLVLFLGDTGAGKTTFMDRLREIYLEKAITCIASDSWRNYYYSTIGVAEGLGIVNTNTNPRILETDVFNKLRILSPVLIIDEAHDCGPKALNLVKAILNKTTARVVLVGMPGLWDRLQRQARDEARQIRRRTFAKIVMNEVEPANCRLFLAAKMPGYAGLNGEESAVVEACRASANKFGLYDTLERICSEMRKEMGDKAAPASLDRVTAAISRAEALR